MRILVCFAGGRGHFEPIRPVAAALKAAGHTVAVAGAPMLAPIIEALGFPMFGTGPNFDAPVRRPLLELDIAREERDLREGFARRTATRRVSELLALGREWRPELILHDEVDFGAAIAAERLGIPWVNVIVLLAGGLARLDLIAEPLDELRATHGLPPDPDVGQPHRHLVLYGAPPALRDPAFPLPDTARTFRPMVPRPGESDGRTVYFTLGTVFNMESGDLFPRVLAGLRELPVNLVVTVGRHIDPAEFGPQPAHVRIERFVPQAELLPRCDLVVSHGGSGSVVGALAHGLPQVHIPMGADQPHNAARAAALGFGRTLNATTVTPEEVRDTVADVLADPAYRAAATDLAIQTAAQPDPAELVAVVEALRN